MRALCKLELELKGGGALRPRREAAVTRILLLIACTLPGLAQTPTITNVTNAAIPFLDQLPGWAGFAPGTLATIFGTNLADKAVSTAPPWPSILGGVQVHLIIGISTPCATANPPTTLVCEIPVDLLYVSPTQINFLVPDILGRDLWRRVHGSPGRNCADSRRPAVWHISWLRRSVLP